MNEALLQMSLEAAIGVRLMQWRSRPEMRKLPWDEVSCLECKGEGCGTCNQEGRLTRQEANANFIAAHGDALMFKTRGLTADVFNVLAESLAMLAYVPGGVTFMGLHFEEKENQDWPGPWAKRMRKVVEEFAKRVRVLA